MKRSWQLLLIAAVMAMGVPGCSFVGGLLRMRPVEVTAHFPDEEFVDPGAVQNVSVSFSSPMNRPFTEQAFSLRRDSEELEGRFSWQEADLILVFTPAVPLQAQAGYAIEVSTAAEDIHGNSLAQPFRFPFSTGLERESPRVTGHSPADGATASSLREAVRVLFSEPVEAASFYSGFSLQPAVAGSFHWSAGGSQVEFRPLEDYRGGESYTVTLKREITDLSGNPLAQEESFHFRAPSEAELEVLSVATAAGGKTLLPASAGGFPDPSLGIEKDERFLLTFCLPVPPERRPGIAGIDPPAELAVSWSADFTACTLSFKENLSWNRIYELKVLEEVYPFVVSGSRSLPISVEALKYCADVTAPPSQGKFVALEFAGICDFSAAVEPVFDFHFRHALEAAIDFGCLLKALSISIENACIGLTALDVELSPLAIDPDPLPGPGQSVARLFCTIVEDPAAAGTVSFRLDEELRDSLGNLLAEEFVLLINN